MTSTDAFPPPSTLPAAHLRAPARRDHVPLQPGQASLEPTEAPVAAEEPWMHQSAAGAPVPLRRDLLPAALALLLVIGTLGALAAGVLGTIRAVVAFFAG